MQVVLDTNILLQEGLESPRMQRLCRLSRANAITIHVPHISLQEFLANFPDDFHKTIRTVAQVSRHAGRLPKDSQLAKQLNRLAQTANDVSQSLDQHLASALYDWKSHNRIQTLPIFENHTSEIFDEYFSGEGIFRHKRAKQDFPDSFISKSLLNLSNQSDSTSFICGDTRFRNSLNQSPECKNGKLKTYESLKVFFSQAFPIQIPESDLSNPDTTHALSKQVGWVERSDTHHFGQCHTINPGHQPTPNAHGALPLPTVASMLNMVGVATLDPPYAGNRKDIKLTECPHTHSLTTFPSSRR